METAWREDRSSSGRGCGGERKTDCPVMGSRPVVCLAMRRLTGEADNGACGRSLPEGKDKKSDGVRADGTPETEG